MRNVILFFLFFSSPVFCNLLSFNDFPSENASGDFVDKLIVDGDDYSSIYLDDAKIALIDGQVNFNGHYVVFVSSCGGGCIYGGIVDKVSGVLIGFPDAFFSGDDDSFELKYKMNSGLICFNGISSETGELGQKCYVVHGGKMEKVPGLLHEK